MDLENISLTAIRVKQPIGDFFVGVMDAKDLVTVSVADVRRLHENEVDEYIGIQRRLSPQRSKELKKYVETYDATFPTAVILAVDEQNVKYDEDSKTLTLMASDQIPLYEVANILDGQHRVDGLTALKGRGFEVSVSIFVGADIATQANIFATVNLAQTKVNRSLVYDLLDYDKKRSPQKSAHHIAVALDRLSQSPFKDRIKRLGSATEGRNNETITQAALVESLLPFMTGDAMTDRNTFLRKLLPNSPSVDELQKHPFRLFFLEEKETEITEIILNFFQVVRDEWPTSWDDLERKGNVLPKTNGVKALIRFLKLVYLDICQGNLEGLYVPSKDEFASYIDGSILKDEEFNIQTFPPGTSGESKLFNMLKSSLETSKKELPLFDTK